jgi:hypothetical protein
MRMVCVEPEMPWKDDARKLIMATLAATAMSDPTPTAVHPGVPVAAHARRQLCNRRFSKSLDHDRWQAAEDHQPPSQRRIVASTPGALAQVLVHRSRRRR